MRPETNIFDSQGCGDKGQKFSTNYFSEDLLASASGFVGAEQGEQPPVEMASGLGWVQRDKLQDLLTRKRLQFRTSTACGENS